MAGIGVSESRFQSNISILSAIFGSKCSFVGSNAFAGCNSLENINNYNSIEQIHEGAFAETKLYSVNFNKLTSIGNGAFSSCSNLTYINIPSCNNIDNSAFYSCTNLKSVNIDGEDISIGNRAFEGCTNLSDIDLKNCKSIGSSAFKDCKSLEIVSLNMCNVQPSAFENCIKLKQLTLTYNDDLPESDVDGIYNNERILSNAFYSCSNLSVVYITAKGIIQLGSSVFYNGNSVISGIRFYLGTNIFNAYYSNSCWSVYKDYMVKLPNKNQIIYTSSDNKQLNIENFDSSNYKHSWVESSESQSIPKYGLIELKDETQSITSLNQKFFQNQKTLTSIDLPSECTEIGDNEFDGCINLNTFSPSPSTDLTEIGEYAFRDCSSLTSFTIPDSIETIGDGVFAGCSNIKKLKGKYVSYNGQAIVHKNTLICVLPTYDDGETDGRFCKISDISTSIIYLGKGCFYKCNKLMRVDIPASIYEINDDAFYGCENLREIHFYGEYVPKLGEDAFVVNKVNKEAKIRNDFKIFVPEQFIEKYINAWFKYDWFKKNNFVKYIYPKPAENQIVYYGTDSITNSTKVELPSYGFTGDAENRIYYKINNLTEIPSNLFSNNVYVNTVLIGEKITKLNSNTFKNCTALNYVYLPNSINNISNNCFDNCTSLTKININNITDKKITFGEDIFYGCTGLKEFESYYKKFVSDDNRCYIDYVDNDVVLNFFAGANYPSTEQYITYEIKSNTITKIGNSAFKDKKIIGAITIPNSVTNIGDWAFKGCSNLKSVKINGYKMKSFGDGAFEDCSSLTSITIPNSVTSIGDRAFDSCSGLTSVTIGNGVTSIGDRAFENCSGLTSITIPDSATRIGNYTFSGCSGLTSVNISKSAKLKSIGNSAFSDCYKLNSATIPDSVTNIGDYAFYECSSLNSVTIPNSVKRIGNYAFYKCSSLTTASISESEKLTSIGDGAFSYCSSLTDIAIPNSVTKINSSTFDNCSCLTTVSVPNGVTSIGNNAFHQCPKLINITIPNSVTSIGDYAFADDTYSNSNKLNNCEITISKNVKQIGVGCFDKTHIKSLTISNDSLLESIPAYAFRDCKSLSTVKILSSNMKEIGIESFTNCIKLNELKISNSVEKIKDKAFYGCEKVEKVKLPKSLKRLFNQCFNTLNVTDVGTSVYIENESTSNIPSFYYTSGNDEKIETNDFPTYPFGNDNTTNIKIYIPKFKLPTKPELILNAYKDNKYWKKYGSKMTTYMINNEIFDGGIFDGDVSIKK